MNRIASQLSRPTSNLSGNLLVASPLWIGHPAPQAVVLLLNHTPEGGLGVVLNSRENEQVRDWCRSLTNREDKEALFRKVSAAGQAHREQNETGFTVCMAKPIASLDQALEQLGTGVRLLVGHTTWRARELEKQIRTGLWLTIPATPDLIFGDHENLWRVCVQRAGEQVLANAPGVTPHHHAALN